MERELMGFYHTVEQGDDLPRIADEYGFRDYKTIWDARENEALRAQRQPTVLLPGDQLYVPDKRIGEVEAAAGSKHRYQLKVSLPRLRIQLTGFDGKPLARTPCTVTLDGSDRAVSTDGDGVLDCPLPPGTEDGVLTVGDRRIDFKVGHLDPVDQRSGLIARLRNLGFLEPGADGDADSEVDDAELAFAVACFQRELGLPVDGDAASIVDKLQEAYGC
jgi:hypothetical protein